MKQIDAQVSTQIGVYLSIYFPSTISVICVHVEQIDFDITITFHVDGATNLVHDNIVFWMSQPVCKFTPICNGLFVDIFFLILLLGTMENVCHPSCLHLTIVMSIHIFEVSMYGPTSTVKLVRLYMTTNNGRAVAARKISLIATSNFYKNSQI